MKKQLIIILLLVLASMYTYSQDSQANWKPSVLVDGAVAEWRSPLRFYSNEVNLFFSIANNNTHLFLCFQTNDEKAQMKICKAGMKIGLKAKGKLKCDASIDFPMMGKQEHMVPPEEEEHSERPNIKEKRNAMMAQNTNLSAKGFATQNGILSIKENNGIQASINWDDKNMMTYELAIPLKELFDTTFVLKDMAKALTMSILVNGFTRPERPNREGGSGGAADMSGGPGGGMGGGGMGGGGMGGGGRGGGGGGGRGGGGHHKSPDSEESESPGEEGRAKMFESGTFKQRFILAQHVGD